MVLSMVRLDGQGPTSNFSINLVGRRGCPSLTTLPVFRTMGKHDDDDDDEKSAYVSNARSSGGGGKGSEPGDEDDMLNPVVKAFCHHVVSSKFRKELDTFFSFNCDDFEDADVDSEQRLEWTATFEKYVAKIEEMLETFCGAHKLEAEGVFTMVQRACASGIGCGAYSAVSFSGWRAPQWL